MPQLPGGHVAVGSIASRLSFGEDANLAATIGNSGALHASYWQKCSDQLQMGVELDANLRSKEASAHVHQIKSLNNLPFASWQMAERYCD